MNHSIEKTKVVEVSAAVLEKPNGSFMLAQRPSDKIWAGYWEFPGGKVEAGESAHDALLRELREELGIEVRCAYPWITRVFTYPHATVRLSFFRVTEWSGDPRPLEGQQFSWQMPDNVAISPILPANEPILNALRLPLRYAISNATELGSEVFLVRLEQALERGLKLMQLREKSMPDGELHELALRTVHLAHGYGARVLISGDVDLARKVGADGVHLSSAQLRAHAAHPDVALCAASCHDEQELALAQKICDFALLSPVLPTLSHPGAKTLGWDGFEKLVQGVQIPVYALGGLKPNDLSLARARGAHGIALLRQAW